MRAPRTTRNASDVSPRSMATMSALESVLALVLLSLVACNPPGPPSNSSASASASASAVGATPGATSAKADPPSAPPSSADAGPEESAALDIIYVPTPQKVVDKMLEVAKVTKSDVVYDLGCGDGRIVVSAAKKLGARGLGFDLDPERIKEANENVKGANVGALVSIKQENVFSVDLTPATVVTLYLLPEINVKLIPQLEKLKPGSRIVSHDFDMVGVTYEDWWTVIAQDHVDKSKNREHYVYLWNTPLKKEAAKPAKK